LKQKTDLMTISRQCRDPVSEWPSSARNDEVASSTVPSDSTTTGWKRWIPCRDAYLASLRYRYILWL